MTRPPSFPEDAAVGSPVGRAEGPAANGSDEADAGRRKRRVTGAAIGIGSAALVAALLYANRSGRRPPEASPAKPLVPEPSD